MHASSAFGAKGVLRQTRATHPKSMIGACGGKLWIGWNGRFA
jgi:hypothetical protein